MNELEMICENQQTFTKNCLHDYGLGLCRNCKRDYVNYDDNCIF